MPTSSPASGTAVPRPTGSNPTNNRRVAAQQYYQQTGRVPKGYQVGPDGRLIETHTWYNGGWVPWAIMAGLVGGPVALNALGAGGGAAGAGAGGSDALLDSSVWDPWFGAGVAGPNGAAGALGTGAAGAAGAGIGRRLFGGGGSGAADSGFDWLTAALLGGSTIADLFGAHQAANASEEAARLQYASTQDALNFLKQQYSQNQINQAPWLQAGRGAVSKLSYLMGVPMNEVPQAPGAATTPLGTVGTPPTSPTTPPPSAPAPPPPVRRPPPATPTPPPPAPPADPPSHTPYANGGGTVLMRAPNGQIQPVPADQVAHYQALGAQVVS